MLNEKKSTGMKTLEDSFDLSIALTLTQGRVLLISRFSALCCSIDMVNITSE